MPINLVITLIPVLPNNLSNGPPKEKNMNVRNTTEIIADKTTKVDVTPETSLSHNKIIVAIEPGPAINGLARGKTEEK